MIGRGIAGVFIVATASLLAACSPWASEAVLLRKPSPDGQREAVLMTCRNPSDPSAQRLVGAVFRREAGQAPGCNDLAAPATASWFDASMQALPPATGETVEWVEGRAVFTLRRRIIISQTRFPGEMTALEVQALDLPEIR
ncbi:hypothetical protein [Phreatobacter stygius]|uniref:Lipoprotein n=1 Tax=Phreatobacter stygius TaxID=1940610 RepID=A0A4D7AZF5_9HYPH|nr:hypothetical protein [Phreatobacter stygius]QCI63120.1 hypothetical protein E8M01_02030 [Phreatobacter stygius]